MKRNPLPAHTRGRLVLAFSFGVAALVLDGLMNGRLAAQRSELESVAVRLSAEVQGDSFAGSSTSPGSLATVAVLRAAAERDGLGSPIRVLTLRGEARRSVESQPEARHEGALAVLASTGEDEPEALDYDPDLSTAFLGRATSVGTSASSLFTTVHLAHTPVFDSFGSQVAVLEVPRRSVKPLFLQLLRLLALIGTVASGVLVAERVLAKPIAHVRELHELRRERAALERRSRARPGDLGTRLEDARHGFARALKEAGVNRPDLHATLRAAILAVQKIIDWNRVRIVPVVADDLPSLSQEKLVLVFAALDAVLENAVARAPTGGAVTIRMDRAPGGDLRIEVVDGGRGISWEKQDALRRSLQTTPAPGTSGLDVASTAVHRLDGAIGFESQPGHGTRFWFTLPCGAGGDAEKAPSLTAGSQRASGSPARPTSADPTAVVRGRGESASEQS